MNRNQVYIIAEAGVNHNGDISLAKKLIEVAAAAGADAVKFQTFRADQLVCRAAPKAEYQIRTTDSQESQHDMICKLELDIAAHEELIAHCRECGIQFLSTPFDCESVDLLAVYFDLPIIKIPSGEITNAPLLLRIAQTGKPVILSTGMSTLEEVEDALAVLAFGYLNEEYPSTDAFKAIYHSEAGQAALKSKVSLLHCTTEYPAPYGEVNLRAMDTLRNAFGLPVGFSDHTTGITSSIAAVARDAVIIEKHFTLDRTLPGPDHKASLEPCELKEMVVAIRTVETVLGGSNKAPTPSELKNIIVARKSLVASRRIEKGEKLSAENLATKRPGDGVSPMLYWDRIGQRACKTIDIDEQIP